MSYYQRHLIFCCNQRAADADRPSCAGFGAQAAREHAKQRIKSLQLAGPGQVRINQAGCLDRCEEGPVVVVYPDAVWYTYVDNDDIDEIIDQHVIKGQPVARLMI
jgi:(2Fe-2S) ferredoxin